MAPPNFAFRWLCDRVGYIGDGCLLWPFATSRKGYGQVRFGGRVMNAHRAMCLMAHGEPQDGETEAAHSCGNRLCCNPNHLRHATPKENAQDKHRHGTTVRGEAMSIAIKRGLSLKRERMGAQ